MAKSNQTANEAQLKARRTSLGKKSKDDLINIVLRKDKSERSMNAKIQELTALLKEADSLNEEKATRISNFDSDMSGMQDKINTLVEKNDSLTIDKLNLQEDIKFYQKDIVRLKNKCNLFRKSIITCFGLIVVLIMCIFIV